MKRFSLPLMNVEIESNSIDDLKPILFEFMDGEGYDDHTHSIVPVNALNEEQQDIVGYFAPEDGNVHFFGKYCFIVEYK